MKIVIVLFPDGTDISSLAIGSTVNVGSVAGTVSMAGDVVNPPAPTLVPHIHIVPGNSGSVSVPPTQTGPAE